MSRLNDLQTNDFHLACRTSTPIALAFCISGNAWARKGDLDRAIEDYDTVLIMQPALTEVLVNRGNAWVGKGNFDRAIEDYDAALRINPKDEKAARNRALALKLKSGSNPH